MSLVLVFGCCGGGNLGESERERERERARDHSPGERKREREILAQVLHLCLGGCAAPLHREGAGGLTWTVPPGEPSQFSQRCLSRTSDAVLLKAPLVALPQVEQ